MQDFKKLQVWQKAHKLTLAIYQYTVAFPKDEMFSLTSQTRRAAASIPANTAEGCGRNGSAEMARFLQISMGSASELEYQIILAQDLTYLTDDRYTELNNLIIEVKQMLTGLILKMKQ
jgi:four helix bundle protein